MGDVVGVRVRADQRRQLGVSGPPTLGDETSWPPTGRPRGHTLDTRTTTLQPHRHTKWMVAPE